PMLWKSLKIEGWGLFKALAKFTSAVVQGDFPGAEKEAFGAIQYVKFKEDDGELAWALVYNSMTRAIVGLLPHDSAHINADQMAKLAAWADKFDGKIAAAGIAIDQTFFDRPGWSEYVREISRQLRAWLIAGEMSDADADNVVRQLPSVFTLALDMEWL